MSALSSAKQGKNILDVSAYETALSLAGKVLAEIDPSYGSLLANHAFVLRKVGRKAEAKFIAQRSRQIQNNLDRTNGSGTTVRVTALRAGRN